jgi:Fe-S cluster assembly iron-binding protein IscA
MPDKVIPMIKLEPGVSQAILSFIKGDNQRRPIRIDLNFTGCCDATLCLALDALRENDLISEKEGLTFVIGPEVYDLAGDITVSYLEEESRKGFVIKSKKPLGEWEGFGLTDIKI